MSDAQAAALIRLLWRERKYQNLQLPPHKRSEPVGFQLDGLGAEAARVAPEVVRGLPAFAPDKHDFEIVPTAAFTIEPRKEAVSGTGTPPTAPGDDMFFLCSTKYVPAADFKEKVASVIASSSPGRSIGAIAVYVLLVAEPARLKSARSPRPSARLRRLRGHDGAGRDHPVRAAP